MRIMPGDMCKPCIQLTDDMVLYHATFDPYLSSIKRNGLVIGRSPLWQDVCVDHKSTRIYLANDLECALDFCECVQDEDEFPEELVDSAIVVLVVKVKDLRLLDKKLNRNGFVCDDGMVDGGLESGTVGYRYNIPVELLGITAETGDTLPLRKIRKLDKTFFW